MVCKVSGRCPDLLSVDDPFVTVEHCATTKVSEVAAGRWFAVSLTPTIFTGQYAGKVMLLLLFGADSKNGVAQHPDTETVVWSTSRNTGLCKFFCDHE